MGSDKRGNLVLLFIVIPPLINNGDLLNINEMEKKNQKSPEHVQTHRKHSLTEIQLHTKLGLPPETTQGQWQIIEPNSFVFVLKYKLSLYCYCLYDIFFIFDYKYINVWRY